MILKDRDITVMGILNLTPDSYFAESRCMDADGNIDLGQVLEKIRKMFADGAGIVDIGACSTRPGAELPDEDEEWRRLSVLMPVLRKEFPERTFSVDTFRSGIVRKCFEAIGNFIVNDISAGEDDPKMLETVGKLGLTYVAMHKKGTPSDMQERCNYGDVTEDVLAYFRDFAVRADNAGITAACLQKLGIECLFDGVYTDGAGYPAKPDPFIIDMIVKEHGAEREGLAMVGDTRTDLFFARRGRILGIGYAQNEREKRLLAPLADEVIGDFCELPRILERKIRAY